MYTETYISCHFEMLHLFTECELASQIVAPQSVSCSATSVVSTAWSHDLSIPAIHSFIPSPQTGPTRVIPSEPGDVFQLFFTSELIQQIVVHSNLYAKKVMVVEKYNKWHEITCNDIVAF